MTVSYRQTNVKALQFCTKSRPFLSYYSLVLRDLRWVETSHINSTADDLMAYWPKWIWYVDPFFSSQVILLIYKKMQGGFSKENTFSKQCSVIQSLHILHNFSLYFVFWLKCFYFIFPKARLWWLMILRHTLKETVLELCEVLSHNFTHSWNWKLYMW